MIPKKSQHRLNALIGAPDRYTSDLEKTIVPL